MDMGTKSLIQCMVMNADDPPRNYEPTIKSEKKNQSKVQQ